MQPHWPQLSHPDILKVISKPGDFSSYSISQGSFAPGTLLARLTAPTLTLTPRAYSTVQVGPQQTDNIELNCDFLFINHSCEPNLEFHVLNSKTLSARPASTPGTIHDIVIEIRVALRRGNGGEVRGLEQGEVLTFFYPSSEWDMAQPFTCLCGAKGCKGLIRGARYLERKELEGYFVNEHIWELKGRQELLEEGKSGNGSEVSKEGSESDRTDGN